MRAHLLQGGVHGNLEGSGVVYLHLAEAGGPPPAPGPGQLAVHEVCGLADPPVAGGEDGDVEGVEMVCEIVQLGEVELVRARGGERRWKVSLCLDEPR